MRAFLFFTASFIIGAVVATAAVFWYVQTTVLVPIDEERQSSAQLESSPVTTPPQSASATTPVYLDQDRGSDTDSAAKGVDTNAEAIPLSDVELTSEQRALAESLGIDSETFVIQPAMIECARTTLGSDRFAEIQAGARPGPLETARLLPCLRAGEGG